MNARPVILDTDWYTDVDDAMAVRALINFQKQGVFRILGLCINARFEESVRSLDAFLLAHGVDVPIGIVQEWHDDSAPNGPSYQKRLAAMKSKYADNRAAEIPARLYRRLLASSPDKVTLISIGFTENYAALLESAPDEISPLSGRELVAQKVEELWMMAGTWTKDGGQEYNLAGAGGTNPLITQSSSKVLSLWPTPITFLGFEIGYMLLSGGKLPKDDILWQAMDDYNTQGYRLANPEQHSHHSWDPLTIVMAGLGSPEKAGFFEIRGLASTDPSSGKNHFRQDPDGPHRFVVKKHFDSFYSDLIDEWLKS